MKIERFEDIEAWKFGRQTCQEIFSLAEAGGLGRDSSLKDPMFCCSGSIMANVAEGFDGGGNREFMRFLQYAKRSHSELRSELYRALDRKDCAEARFGELYELARFARSKIGAFIKYLSPHADKRTH